jgi:hypothetical protein
MKLLILLFAISFADLSATTEPGTNPNDTRIACNSFTYCPVSAGCCGGRGWDAHCCGSDENAD